MKEIERKRFVIKLDGEVYDLPKPSVKRIKLFNAELTGLKDQNDADVPLVNLLVDMGLPRDKMEELDVETLEEIAGELMAKKKS